MSPVRSRLPAPTLRPAVPPRVVVSWHLHAIGTRNPPRIPRDRRADRRGRDGRGVPRARHEARPRRRSQGASGGHGVEPGTARAVPARGPRRRRAESPPHRDDPLGGGVGRRPLSDHGARRGSAARPRHRRGDAAGRPARRDRHRARRRARGGAREGHHPPGPEAGQRHGGTAGGSRCSTSVWPRSNRPRTRPRTAPGCRPR